MAADTRTQTGTPTTPTDAATRPRLPRRPHFTGHHTPNELAAIRATLATTTTRLPIPLRTWNGSTANPTDGLLLIHNPSHDRVFTAHIACPHGAIHGWPINTPTDLQHARNTTRACTQPHTPLTDHNTDHDWDKAIAHGVRPNPQPRPLALLQLREAVRRARAAADNDQPKEHPQP